MLCAFLRTRKTFDIVKLVNELPKSVSLCPGAFRCVALRESEREKERKSGCCRNFSRKDVQCHDLLLLKSELAEAAASVPSTELVGKGEYFRFSKSDSDALEAAFLEVLCIIKLSSVLLGLFPPFDELLLYVKVWLCRCHSTSFG